MAVPEWEKIAQDQVQNGMAQRKKEDANTWQKHINMINFSTKADFPTMLGYALGQYIKNYRDRGAAKAQGRQDEKDLREADANLLASQQSGVMQPQATPQPQVSAMQNYMQANPMGQATGDFTLTSNLEDRLAEMYKPRTSPPWSGTGFPVGSGK